MVVVNKAMIVVNNPLLRPCFRWDTLGVFHEIPMVKFEMTTGKIGRTISAGSSPSTKIPQIATLVHINKNVSGLSQNESYIMLYIYMMYILLFENERCPRKEETTGNSRF